MMIALHHLRPACPQREKGAKTVRRYRQAVRAYTDNANRKKLIAKSHADGHLRYRLAVSMAFLNDPDLLVIRPATSTARVSDRQYFNAGGVFVCVHKDTR
ncbi:MAG: hypothetical protein R3D81_13805 [Thalassovita sp.]